VGRGALAEAVGAGTDAAGGAAEAAAGAPASAAGAVAAAFFFPAAIAETETQADSKNARLIVA
jgi:hypothetical protein